MSEHIEAYLKQHHCRDYFNAYGETVEDDHYFMYREEVDGLIELVVRNCISVVNKRYMGDNNREDMEVLRCVDELKKLLMKRDETSVQDI